MTELNDEDDFTAAEFVLGTLDATERTAASARIAADSIFSEAVDAWHRRLDPLSENGRDAEPSPHVWLAIMERLGFTGGGRSTPRQGAEVLVLRRQVRRWRWATTAVSALAACVAGLAVFQAVHHAAPTGPTLVAFLQKTGNAQAIIVKADMDDRKLAVRPVDVKAAPGRSYELWMIDPSLSAPKSLGTLDGPASTPRSFPAGVTPEVAERATYAVTDEPAGGSPTGAPSGTPIYVGHLVSAAF